MCETLHRFHRHSGKSVMVEKRCARPTECNIESIGCEKLHSKHHRHQMVSTREIVHAILLSTVIVFLFFRINFFEIFFQEHHQSVKQFGSRSGPNVCQA